MDRGAYDNGRNERSSRPLRSRITNTATSVVVFFYHARADCIAYHGNAGANPSVRPMAKTRGERHDFGGGKGIFESAPRLAKTAKSPMKTHNLLRLILLIVSGLLLFAPLRAQFVAVGINDGAWNSNGGSSVYGWSFTTQTTIEVTSIGLYDVLSPINGRASGDGLIGSHPVGIWELANHTSPLVTTVIPSGFGTELLDGFRYVDIKPVVLAAGHQYAIAALYHSEDNVVGQVNNPSLVFTTGPGIHLGDYRFARDATDLVFPDLFEPGPLSGFGPNFTYSILSPVPEPSLYGVMGAASLGCVVLVRRYHNKRARVTRG